MLSANLQQKLLIINLILLSAIISCDRSTLEPINEPAGENHSPIISAMILSRDTISIRDTCSIFCDAYDPDSDSLEYTWYKDWGYFKPVSNELVLWQSPMKYGKYKILCEINDNRGGTCKDSIEVNVLHWKPLVFPIPMIQASNHFDFENNGSDDIIFNFMSYMTHDVPPSTFSHFFDIISINNTSFLIDTLGKSPPFPYGFNISSIPPNGYTWESNRFNFGTCNQNLSGSIYITSYRGPWVGILNQYFPLRISRNNEHYYGWVEMSMDTTKASSHPLGKYIIHKYRINTIPNESIVAGE